MKHIVLILFNLTLLTHTLSAQFELCNSPTSQNLWDIHFIDEETGVAVGDSGTIIRSTDGGWNWSTVMFADSVRFKKVAFFDESRGLAVGTHVFRTDDGGNNWSLVPLSNELYTDLEVFDSGKCLLSGIPVALMHSEDYGLTWDTLIHNHPDNGLGLIDFIDEEIGYACIKGPHLTNRVYKTIDGGRQWNMIQSLTGEDNSIIEAFDFYSEDIGVRGGWYNPHLTRTETGAEAWEGVAIDSLWFQFQMYDLHIEKGQDANFWGCGWHGLVVRSEDLGQNWEFMGSVVPTDRTLYGIHFVNRDLGWIVGQSGVILRTENGGGSVDAEQPVNEEFLRIYPNPTNGPLTIEYPEGPIHTVRIIDRLGTILKEYPGRSSLDLGALSSGLYFIGIGTERGRILKRVMLTH